MTPSKVNVQSLLDKVHQWSLENGIELNVAKCGHVSARFRPEALFLGSQQIPPVQSYTYLGFPVTARGVDFAAHLQKRITAAVNRTKFLSLYSDKWGPAHRLRVYKQYVAPMFEYGAPLVHAWASETRDNLAEFDRSVAGFKDLIAWIAHSSGSRHLVTANLCGLVSPVVRFQQLRTAFQLVLEGISTQNPLRRILDGLGQRSPLLSFAYNLRSDVYWSIFKRTSDLKPDVKKALHRYLRACHRQSLMEEAQEAYLTALVPIESRRVPGLRLADISLTAPMPAQDLLFQYRRGMFMFNFGCTCREGVTFGRSHETCSALPHPVRLTKAEKAKKALMQHTLQLGHGTFTDIDYLLNVGRIHDASHILTTIRDELRRGFSVRQAQALM